MNSRIALSHRLFLPAALLVFAVTAAGAQNLPSTGAASSQTTPTQSVPAQAAPAQTANNPSPLRLPSILSNNAVLQRGRPIHIWGWSNPSENITVAFHNQTEQTTADAQGNWELWLAPEPAGGPYTLTVTGSNNEPPITLTNVLVGDVWFASGQSNMQIPLKGFNSFYVIKNSAQEIANSTGPDRYRVASAQLLADPADRHAATAFAASG